MARRTLLINWVFQPPVGHVIEALRLAQDFAAADPEVRISLLLNARAPLELASCVPAVSSVYAIDVESAGNPSGFPQTLPREWDYVFTMPRAGKARDQALNRFHAAFREWVRTDATNQGWERTPPRVRAPLRLQLPATARAEATTRLTADRSPRVSVLLGAGSHFRAPSLRFWNALLEAYFTRHPHAEIVLLGALATGRTQTQGVTRQDIDALCRNFPGIVDAFDAGILVQLALAERCAVHVSPHSGMSFAVQAVGVPWVALSGQEWHEFLLNGVPLIAILPDCPLYPCFRKIYPECETLRSAGKLTPCIADESLLRKLPEILEGMETLIAGKLDYRTAALRHEAALRARLGDDSWVIVDWPEVAADDYVF